MTKMRIDYKASTGKADKCYIVDRDEWPDLWELTNECMTDDVYLIEIVVDGRQVIKARNEK